MGEQNNVAVDVSALGKQLWLIKVPKNLENALLKAPKNSPVGTLTVTRQSGKKPVMKFEPSGSVLNAKSGQPDGQALCVAEHYSLDPVSVDRQTLSVFSETDTPPMEVESGSSGKEHGVSPVSALGSVRIEGCIKTRGEMRPPKSTSYLKLKVQEFKQQNIPTKLTKLTSEVNNYKPRAHAINTMGLAAHKGQQQQARVREEVGVVRDRIFKAFELHQYYNIQDLQKKTGQPVNYLKEILTQIADYNTNPPHRFTWELKPQYRHYGSST